MTHFKDFDKLMIFIFFASNLVFSFTFSKEWSKIIGLKTENKTAPIFNRKLFVFVMIDKLHPL